MDYVRSVAMTFAERLKNGLLALGWEEAPTTSKYIAMKHKESTNFLFIGKSGALRAGRVASSSVSIGDPTNRTDRYNNILKAAGLMPSDYKDNTLVSIVGETETEIGRVFDHDDDSNCIYVQVPRKFDGTVCVDDGIREVPLAHNKVTILS